MAGEQRLAVVGKRRRRVDGAAKALGQARYADDIALPRMVYCKLLRSPHPHALIKAVDTARAERAEGVLLVLTGRDFHHDYGILPVSQDERPLCNDRVRFVGDPVAAVIARDELTAQEALDLIEVEYEPLPTLASPAESLANPEPQLHDYAEEGNVHRRLSYEFGDVEEALRASAHVFEDVFFYQGNTHLPLEQHAAVAAAEASGQVTLWTSTQCPHYVHRAMAKALDIPMARIRVIASPQGGGFGGKTDPFNHEMVVAKAAMILGRPVKIALTREEVFYCHRGRHPVLMKFTTGVDEAGRLTGMHLQTMLDGGAYGSYGIASTFYTAVLTPVTYELPRFAFDAARVFTNKPPCGPKRGHGTVQPRFGQEIQLDKIADKLGQDPAELRRAIVAEPNSLTANYLQIHTIGLKECIDRVVARSDWQRKFRQLPYGKGVGIACSSYMSGAGNAIYWNKMPHSGVQLKLDRSGKVTVYCGIAEVGQGCDDVLVGITAEMLGLQPEDVRCVTADTDLTPVDLGSYSSRVTVMAGNAAVQAGERACAILAASVAARLEVRAERLVFGEGRVFDTEDPDKGLDFAQAVVAAEEDHGTLATTGSYAPPKPPGKYKGSGVGPSTTYSYTAAVVEVEVDPDTGWIIVPRIFIAHDIGRALNPVLAEGQVIGSVYMGLGEALMEEQEFLRLAPRHSDALVHRNPSMLEYKSIAAHDMPEVVVDLVESPDAQGPFGAKEVGQGPLLPIMPAVANAVYDAVGVRIDEVPITPEKILKALAEKAKGREGRYGPKAFPELGWSEPYQVPPPWEGGDGSAINRPQRKRAAKMHRMDKAAAP